MNHECWLSAIVPRRAPSCEPNHRGREYRSIRTRCFSMYFPIAASTFLLEGKGSQARVWYKVMCRWYSYRLSRKRLVLVCFSKLLQKDPFVPIHGMSYPRGDTFPNTCTTRRFSKVCPRSVADAPHTYTHTLLQIGDMIEMTRIGFMME